MCRIDFWHLREKSAALFGTSTGNVPETLPGGSYIDLCSDAFIIVILITEIIILVNGGGKLNLIVCEVL